MPYLRHAKRHSRSLYGEKKAKHGAAFGKVEHTRKLKTNIHAQTKYSVLQKSEKLVLEQCIESLNSTREALSVIESSIKSTPKKVFFLK